MTATEREYPFKFAERCLYEYPENCSRLEKLRERLAELYASSSARAQSYEAADHSTGPGDPVAVRTLKIMGMEEEAERLRQRTEPITRLMADLEAPYVLQGSPKAELALIMRLCYFGKSPKKQVADKLNMTERSLRRQKEKLVRLVLFYAGL